MPTSINPWLLFIGISPGRGNDDGRDIRTGFEPSVGSPNQSFCGQYLPTNWDCPYWKKVRALSSGLIGALYPGLSEADCLSLSGQLNLGLRNQGQGKEDAVDSKVALWVSTVIATQLKPRVIIGFGLRSLIYKAKLKEAWGAPSPLSIIRETNPFREERLKTHPHLKFRLWTLSLEDGIQSLFVLWPNHPSRAPFSGDFLGTPWQSAIKQCVSILKAELSTSLPLLPPAS
jgi:hypothetical protein